MAEIASFDSTLVLRAICLHNYIRLDSSSIIHFSEKNATRSHRYVSAVSHVFGLLRNQVFF